MNSSQRNLTVDNILSQGRSHFQTSDSSMSHTSAVSESHCGQLSMVFSRKSAKIHLLTCTEWENYTMQQWCTLCRWRYGHKDPRVKSQSQTMKHRLHVLSSCIMNGIKLFSRCKCPFLLPVSGQGFQDPFCKMGLWKKNQSLASLWDLNNIWVFYTPLVLQFYHYITITILLLYFLTCERYSISCLL